MDFGQPRESEGDGTQISRSFYGKFDHGRRGKAAQKIFEELVAERKSKLAAAAWKA